MGGFDIGASASTSSAAQSGNAQSGTGGFNVTFGSGGLSGLLPATPAGQAWLVYLVLGAVAITGLFLFFKFRK
jgi:hypothetical protein